MVTKTFTYEVVKKTYYSEQTDEEFEDSDEFEYEVDYYDFIVALKKLVVEEYGDKAWDLVGDFGLYDEVAEGYEEQLKQAFEDKAMEYYHDYY